MANRPIFVPTNTRPFVKAVNTDFQWYSGFAVCQKQKSIRSLHKAYTDTHPNERVLEISSKSEEQLGKSLSAFNLPIFTHEKRYIVEVLFQGSRVYADGTYHPAVYNFTPREAKAFINGKPRTIGFRMFDVDYTADPYTFFYDWLYINAVNQMSDVEKQKILQYDGFTDIEFNPNRGKNCQARSLAIWVSLTKQGLLAQALSSPEAFLKLVYDR